MLVRVITLLVYCWLALLHAGQAWLALPVKQLQITGVRTKHWEWYNSDVLGNLSDFSCIKKLHSCHKLSWNIPEYWGQFSPAKQGHWRNGWKKAWSVTFFLKGFCFKVLLVQELHICLLWERHVIHTGGSSTNVHVCVKWGVTGHVLETKINIKACLKKLKWHL